jgi:RAQPRD family integrative conjugative element protein
MQITGGHAVRTIFLLGVIVIGVHCPLTLADADAEREVLARIIHELELLEPLLTEAKAAADADARIHFRYDWLRKDLERVRRGIQEHIDAPRAEPRAVAPLRGDYRR